MLTQNNGNVATSLKGRVALVTGAGKGIGRAISLALAGRGAAVALNYRTSRAETESVAEEIQAMGVDCLVLKADVAVSEQARVLVEKIVERFKRLDILVNNAGITKDKAMRKVAGDDWSDVISINLNGTYYCTSAVLPAMVEQKYGRIINISPHLEQNGNLGQAKYAASRGGILAFTKAVATEMARYNITANAIAPGFTCTEMTAQIPEHILDQIKAKIPLGRLAMPDEIAKVAVFLAADADYITGQQLNVDGGLYM